MVEFTSQTLYPEIFHVTNLCNSVVSIFADHITPASWLAVVAKDQNPAAEIGCLQQFMRGLRRCVASLSTAI
jgi:hypothetical protein